MTLLHYFFDFFRLKVSKFQNEFMKSSFLPKYEQKIVVCMTKKPVFIKSIQFLLPLEGRDFRTMAFWLS